MDNYLNTYKLPYIHLHIWATADGLSCHLQVRQSLPESFRKGINQYREILIDEINDIATQYIGDILIDTFDAEMSVLEQYVNELKEAIKRYIIT